MRNTFKTLLLADPDVAAALSPADLDRAFDLDEQLRHVDQVLERTFQTAPREPHPVERTTQ